jgi:hypothetical protein
VITAYTAPENQTTMRNVFIKEGMQSYLEVVKAIHLFQTEVAELTSKVLESRRDRIKSAMDMAKDLQPVEAEVWPTLDDDDYNFDTCSISAKAWIDDPQWCTLYLSISFGTEPDENPEWWLYCGVEVREKHRWRKWLGIVAGHPDRYDEEWEYHAVGLRRRYLPSQDLSDGLITLLDDFLCCAKP